MKLLIVDDERVIRQTIAEHINWASIGVEVIGTAKDGVEAYDLILDYYPDIVMTDIKMPGLSGLALIQKIRQVNADVEFIILSGYAEFDFARQAMQAGIRHYLLKPCSEEQLLLSVQTVMEELEKKRAHSLHKEPTLWGMEDLFLRNIISEGVAQKSNDFGAVYSPYRKFLDLSGTPYELCHFYFTDEADRQEVLHRLLSFWQQFAPGVPLYSLYVHQTLLFFFRRIPSTLGQLDPALTALANGSMVYSRVSHPSLSSLLDRVISCIRRYDTIYYATDGAFLPICNYRNSLSAVESATLRLFSETGPPSLLALEDLLRQVEDLPFLRQLASTVVMLFVSRITSFTALQATELLLFLGTLTEGEQIRTELLSRLKEVLADYQTGPETGSISAQVCSYVQENFSDPNLSLKQIAENHLYMNVDYVSKRFFKETGKKFSRYLAELRIDHAKRLLSDGSNDKILFVAESVGCGNNPQYFSQLFKKETGYTPSNYVKYIQGGHQK